MTTIADVKIGRTVNSQKNGEGIVIAKTKRTITVFFKNGNKIKNTYRYSNAYFYDGDF